MLDGTFLLDVHQDPSHDIYGVIMLGNGIMMDGVLGWVPENLELALNMSEIICVHLSALTPSYRLNLIN